jgi:hypothetical protein
MKQYQIEVFNSNPDYDKEYEIGNHLSADTLLSFSRRNGLLYTEQEPIIKIYDKKNNTCLRARLMEGQKDLFGG